MKKILAITLVFVMILAMSLPAFAEEATLTQDFDSVVIDINGIKDSDEDGIPDSEDTEDDRLTVVAVDIVWDEMTFTYISETQIWNPDSMTYEYVEGGWKTDEIKEISVSNRSNVPISTSLNFEGPETHSVGDLNVAYTWDDEYVYGTTLPAATPGDEEFAGVPYDFVYQCFVEDNSYVPTSDTEKIGRLTLGIAVENMYSEFDLDGNVPNEGDYSAFGLSIYADGQFTIIGTEDFQIDEVKVFENLEDVQPGTNEITAEYDGSFVYPETNSVICTFSEANRLEDNTIVIAVYGEGAVTPVVIELTVFPNH